MRFFHIFNSNTFYTDLIKCYSRSNSNVINVRQCTFLGPNGTRLTARCHFTGSKMSYTSRNRFRQSMQPEPNFETSKEPRNRFHGINSASLCSLAGPYDNPIPTWFLAPLDCFKIPALAGRYDNFICSTDPAGYIGWRNRFLGSLNVYKFGLRRRIERK
jgi:hypothetical protein